MFTDRWTMKMWDIHAMEYCAALKKKILLHATTWMNFKYIMLNEISQLKKTNTTAGPQITLPCSASFYYNVDKT